MKYLDVPWGRHPRSEELRALVSEKIGGRFDGRKNAVYSRLFH